MIVIFQRICIACNEEVKKHTAAQRRRCSLEKLRMSQQKKLRTESNPEIYKKMPASIGGYGINARQYSE